MADKKKTSKGKVIAGVGGVFLLGVGAYVFNEVRKEYDKTVQENNYLRDFIEKHDFYKKEEKPKMKSYFNGSASNTSKQKEPVGKFDFMMKKRTPTTSYKRDDGSIVNEYKNSETGFSLIEVVKAPKQEQNEANNA